MTCECVEFSLSSIAIPVYHASRGRVSSGRCSLRAVCHHRQSLIMWVVTLRIHCGGKTIRVPLRRQSLRHTTYLSRFNEEITSHDGHTIFSYWELIRSSHHTIVVEKNRGELCLLFGCRLAGRKTRVATRTKDSHFSAEAIGCFQIALLTPTLSTKAIGVPRCGGVHEMSISCCMCEPTETAQSLGDDTHSVETCNSCEDGIWHRFREKQRVY